MVNVADEEDLVIFKGKVEHRSLAYKVDEVDDKNFKIIIQGGDLAWEGTVQKEEKEQLIKWLKTRGALRIKKSVRDNLLFAG